MDFRPRLKVTDQLATSLGVTRQHLWGVLTGRNQASPRLARLIETVSGGVLTRSDLRPDLWPPDDFPAAS